MLVRMLVSIAGSRYAYAPGDLVDTNDIPEAAAWARVPMEDGTFRAVAVEAAVGDAVAAPRVERAVSARGRKG